MFKTSKYIPNRLSSVIIRIDLDIFIGNIAGPHVILCISRTKIQFQHKRFLAESFCQNFCQNFCFGFCYFYATFFFEFEMLEKKGCRDGHTVSIYGFEFDYVK